MKNKIAHVFSLVVVTITLVIAMSFNIKKDNTLIFSETKESILYLSNIIVNEYEGQEGRFDIVYYKMDQSKEKDIKRVSRFIIEVIPDENTYRTRSILISSIFYENGENVGHAKPSGKWIDSNKWDRDTVDYYLLHKDSVTKTVVTKTND